MGDLRPRAASRAICRALSSCRAARAARAAAATLWSSGFLPTSYQGVPFRSSGDPILNLHSPDGHHARARARLLRHRGGAEPGAARGSRRPGNHDAHQRLRDGLPHADQRAGTDGSAARNRRRRSRSTAPSRASRPSPTTACWRGGSSSAACASCSSITPIGTITATRTNNLNDAIEMRCREVDQASRRARARSQAARPARGYARRLGRRIRPHADGRESRQRSAAIITSTPSRCGWPAAA